LDSRYPKFTAAVAQKLNEIGRHFNTAPTQVDDHTILFPQSIEGHYVEERRMIYALNLADFFPKCRASIDNRSSITFRLRPEFLQTYDGKRLSPSSTMNDHCKDQSGAISEAVAHLKQQVVPTFVRSLNMMEILPIDSRGLTAELHRHGINVCLLGIN
jgi:hypothetical protein